MTTPHQNPPAWAIEAAKEWLHIAYQSNTVVAANMHPLARIIAAHAPLTNSSPEPKVEAVNAPQHIGDANEMPPQWQRITPECISGLNRARFWTKVDKSPHPKGCWVWMGATKKSKVSRYGNFTLGGRAVTAHRAAYIIAHGSCPDDKQVLHSCDNTLCVNPAHLSLGTNQDNVADMISKGRHKNQVKTHCPHGHALTPDNIETTPSHPNWRYCKKCRQNRKRKSA